MKFATPYANQKKDGFKSINLEPSLTQQSDLNETDINVIMKKYNVTGQVPAVLAEGIFGDFTTVTDFRDAQDKLLAAQEAFAQVPAKIREQFHNDPAEFIEFATNKENLAQLRTWGLAPPEEIKENSVPVPKPETKEP